MTIRVELTRPQALAVLSSLAYASAGGPEDVGLEDDADGRAALVLMSRAADRIAKELNK